MDIELVVVLWNQLGCVRCLGINVLQDRILEISVLENITNKRWEGKKT